MESEQSDSCWYEYSFKSGQILFYYNKTTGEHKWPSSSNKNNKNSISCEPVPHSRFQNNSTQTEDHDCVNGCFSMYIRNGPDMKNGSKVNSNQSKASCLEVNTDSDLVDSEWFGYACKSGQVLFYFNTKTGEHRWASNPHAYEYDKVGELLQSNVEVKSVSTQTHDFGCSNGCTSMYIQNNLKPHADFITTNDNPTCSGTIEAETVVNEVDTTYNVYSSHFKGREDICSGSIETKRTSTYAAQIHASRNQQRRTPNVIANKPDEQDLQSCSEVMVKQEQDDRLGCIFCYYHVDTKEKYYDHLKTHCDCGCPLCGKVSGEESDLLIHLKQHLEGNQSDTNEVKQGIRNSPDRDSRPYNCGRCNKGFSKLSYLKSHERVHLGVKPYRCKCCHKKFSHRNAVKLHQRTHSDLKPYKCAYCDKVFSLRHSLIHHKHVHTKPYKCSFCDKVFLGRNALINHNKRIHNGEKLYECTKCNKRFAKIYGLLSHKRIHTEDKPYKCTYCDKTFRFSTGLKAHERYHTGFKPYSCKYCQKSFSQKDQLRKHENMHAGVKPHTCSLCNKSFAIKQCLKAHLLTHTGEKPYKCEICGKSFRINAYLTDHKRVHTGERPFKCTFCDKTFKLHGDRRKHERTHTGVKPYQCTHCSKAFVRSSELKVHERVHNGDKPFKCADCDKTFVSSSQLYSHKRRIHSEVRSYQCTQCDKAFKLPECLKKHVSRVHIRIKRFKCDCCGMKFIANNELTSHKLTHTDKKPYQCTQCSKTFKRVRQLRVHERVHNN